jgi:DNA polymerase
MSKHLHIDIETYSSGDLKNGGVHVYTESPDFEILLIAYCFDDEPIQLISLAEGEEMPGEFIDGLKDKNVLKFAHNAAFERLCFRAVGFDVPPDQWRCTAVWSSYCGYPLGLDAATKAMGVSEKNLKDNRGKALIRYFCIPCKPTKTNGGRLRNLWHHDQARWSEFKEYCIQDVVAEKAICKHLASYPMPRTEWQNYTIDQLINDRGVMIDREFCKNAIAIDTENRKRIIDKQKQITGLDNPNSLGQLKEWLTDQLGKEIQSLAADKLNTLIEEVEPGPVRDVLSLRKRGSRTSVMKYSKMITCANLDGRARGLFQFYGAGKTGRWAGRRVQPQNLPRTFLKPLDQYRDHFKNNNLDVLDLMYGKTSETLAQLIRTAIIPAPGKVLGVADFSSIEARVLAWLSGESWKLEVFNTHGKIYEAVAANMFNVPIDEVTKGSDLRARGKVAELALGYQGSTGALKTMGAERMGLDETEMNEIVDKWRKASPATCNFWYEVDHYFKMQCYHHTAARL